MQKNLFFRNALILKSQISWMNMIYTLTLKQKFQCQKTSSRFKLCPERYISSMIRWLEFSYDAAMETNGEEPLP